MKLTEGYWVIDTNKKLTDEQRKFQKDQLDKKGNKLENRITIFTIAGLTCFGVATIIMRKRKTLITARESGT